MVLYPRIAQAYWPDLGEIFRVVLGDLGPSQSQKLAHEMRISLTLINSSPTPSTTDVG